MTDPADIGFFTGLQAICAEADCIGDDCRAAIDRAVETRDALDMRAARQAFDALDAEVKDPILARLHQRMATDMSAIWNSLPLAPKTDRMT